MIYSIYTNVVNVQKIVQIIQQYPLSVPKHPNLAPAQPMAKLTFLGIFRANGLFSHEVLKDSYLRAENFVYGNLNEEAVRKSPMDFGRLPLRLFLAKDTAYTLSPLL